MRALGYTEAGLNGVYPSAFVSKAVGLGALKGLVSGSEDGTRADMAQLIYNVLKQQIGKTGQDDKWDSNGPTDTMLRRLGAVVATKTVDGKEVIDEAVVGKDIKPNDEDTLVDLHDLIGHKVTYYVDRETGKKIVAVEEVKTEEISGKLTQDNKGDYKIGDTKFASDYKGTDPLKANPFLNGVLNKEDFVVKTGVKYTWTVEMKGGRVIDVVSALDWVVNADKKVVAKDLKNLTSDEPSLLNINFALNDDDEMDMNSFVLEGVDKLEDIEEGNIVYVYAADANEDGEDEIVKIQVGNKVVYGVVDEVASNGKPTVDGTTYNLAFADVKGTKTHTIDNKDVTDKLDKAIKAGEMLEWASAGKDSAMFLDYFGKVYAVDNDDTTDAGYAILLKYQEADAKKTIDGSVEKVEVFTAAGEDKIYEVKKGVEVPKLLSLVKIKVNDADKITKFEVCKLDEVKDPSVNKKGIVDNQLLNEKTIVFSYNYTGTKNDEDYEDAPYDAANYSIVKAESLFGKEPDSLSLYTKEDATSVTVAYITGAEAANDDYVFITAYSELANSTYKLTVMENGSVVTYKTKNDDVADNLDPTALVKLTLNADGMISSTKDFAKTDANYVSFDLTTGEAIEFSATEAYVKAGDTYYTLADDVVVYLYDISDKKYTAKDTGFLDGLKVKNFTKVEFYDTIDEKEPVEEFTIVVVTQK
ncbi:MAG: hypothetical protein IJK59_00345 [Firmicutes bacterium]|nr:hypothetical protein [Bacillota bacterium]